MEDRKDVLGEFVFGGSCALSVTRLEHHELHVALVPDEPLEELEPESAETVTAGNGN